MTNQVTTEDVFRYHRSTGCPVNEAKELLTVMEPALLARVLRAVQEQTDDRDYWRDPIENDPDTREFVARAAADAKEIILAKGALRMGSCHGIWREQARILKDEYGLEWFSPQKMNPNIFFD